MNDQAVHVWLSPDGEQYEIPAGIFAATKFTKGGWPDKRRNGNAAFWTWLESQKPRSHVDPPAMKVTPEHAAVMAAMDAERAQAYAMRVWSGQSPSVTRAEKIRRCTEALKDQNLPTEGVEYPE